MEGQTDIFGFLGIDENKPNYGKTQSQDLKPLFENENCEHGRYKCNRWGCTTEELKRHKADLPKAFSCSGCCYYCSEAPQHNGKCKFDCRKKV